MVFVLLFLGYNIIFAMIDLKLWLQKQFDTILDMDNNNFGQRIVISISHIPEYDYQTMITKLVMNGKQKELEDFLTQNTELGSIFEYEFTNTEKLNFLSFKIKKNYLFEKLEMFYNNGDLFEFVEKTCEPKKILFDYSSPNMAKDMHVGHLRSTIIGDVLANVYELIGHNVLRINHLGDFGLPFGMIVEYIMSKNINITNETSLQKIYTDAKNEFDSNEEFKTNSYIRTTELQSGTNLLTSAVWKQVYEHSLASYGNIYELLGISKKLTIFGESYYEQFIDNVKTQLQTVGLIEIDDKNRTVVKTISQIPMMFEKSEERGKGYTYDTTDIVTLWYRTQVLKQDQIYYVVDSGQSQHFKQLFEVGKQMKWIDNDTHQIAKHINFGIITTEEGRKIASRIGNTPKLIDVINKGIQTTKLSFEKKGTDVTELVIKSVAVGSIKYFDLAKCRTTNYQFDYNRMLKSDGNTYTYLVYSLARCKSIMDNLNKHNCKLPEFLDQNKLEDVDCKLLRKICEFPSIINESAKENMPHYICDFVYKLASSFHEHYTKTRCINFDSDGKITSFNESRIVCYIMVHSILTQSFKLLGLQIVDKL